MQSRWRVREIAHNANAIVANELADASCIVLRHS